ncbi:MAG: nucleotidyltransferase family protein, partial [Terriglobia bacterium]
MPGRRFPTRNRTTPQTAALKEAIVASFALVGGFEEADWLSVLWWLDVSGMAIYFYDRACEIGAVGLLPQNVEAGLAQRLSDNRGRAKALLDEARALAKWFERGNIPYALLKGVTLTPHSVRESALRS